MWCGVGWIFGWERRRTCVPRWESPFLSVKNTTGSEMSAICAPAYARTLRRDVEVEAAAAEGGSTEARVTVKADIVVVVVVWRRVVLRVRVEVRARKPIVRTRESVSANDDVAVFGARSEHRPFGHVAPKAREKSIALPWSPAALITRCRRHNRESGAIKA